jgi:hypothetical protein
MTNQANKIPTISAVYEGFFSYVVTWRAALPHRDSARVLQVMRPFTVRVLAGRPWFRGLGELWRGGEGIGVDILCERRLRNDALAMGMNTGSVLDEIGLEFRKTPSHVSEQREDSDVHTSTTPVPWSPRPA